MRMPDLDFRIEPLATLGDALCLARRDRQRERNRGRPVRRRRVRDREHRRERGRRGRAAHVRPRSSPATTSAQAIARLYARYAESLPGRPGAHARRGDRALARGLGRADRCRSRRERHRAVLRLRRPPEPRDLVGAGTGRVAAALARAGRARRRLLPARRRHPRPRARRERHAPHLFRDQPRERRAVRERHPRPWTCSAPTASYARMRALRARPGGRGAGALRRARRGARSSRRRRAARPSPTPRPASSSASCAASAARDWQALADSSPRACASTTAGRSCACSFRSDSFLEQHRVALRRAERPLDTTPIATRGERLVLARLLFQGDVAGGGGALEIDHLERARSRRRRPDEWDRALRARRPRRRLRRARRALRRRRGRRVRACLGGSLRLRRGVERPRLRRDPRDRHTGLRRSGSPSTALGRDALGSGGVDPVAAAHGGDGARLPVPHRSRRLPRRPRCARRGRRDGHARRRRVRDALLLGHRGGAAGRMPRFDLYDLEQIDQARARFAELAAPAPSAEPFANAATRDGGAGDRRHRRARLAALRAALRGRFPDVTTGGAWCSSSSTAINTSRSPARSPTGARVALESELLATRGERLALQRARVYEFAGADVGPSEIAFLILTRGRTTRGRIVAYRALGPRGPRRRLRRARRALRGRRGRGARRASAAWRALPRRLRRRDWDAVLALCAPTLVEHDHRRLAVLGTTLARPGGVGRRRCSALVELAPDTRYRVDHVRIGRRAAALVEHLARHARRRRLRDPAHLPSSSSTTQGRRRARRHLRPRPARPGARALRRAGGAGAVRRAASPTPRRATAAPVIAAIDRARLAAASRSSSRTTSACPTAGAWCSSSSTASSTSRSPARSPNWRHGSRRVRAARDARRAAGARRVASTSSADADVGPSEIAFLILIEVDERGRIVAYVRWDLDDLDAAYAELDARWRGRRGDGAPARRGVDAAVHRARRAAAIGRARGPLRPTLVAHDHRLVGLGTRCAVRARASDAPGAGRARARHARPRRSPPHVGRAGSSSRSHGTARATAAPSRARSSASSSSTRPAGRSALDVYDPRPARRRRGRASRRSSTARAARSARGDREAATRRPRRWSAGGWLRRGAATATGTRCARAARRTWSSRTGSGFALPLRRPRADDRVRCASGRRPAPAPSAG